VDAIGFLPDTFLVTADTLYAGGQGTLAALGVATGAQLWRFAAEPAGEGFARDSVVASVDAATGTVYLATYAALYALEAATGGVRWRTPLPTDSAAGILEVSAAGGHVYAAAGNALLGVDPASGRVLWTHQVPDRYAASPVALGDRCLVAGGATVDAVAGGGLLWRHTDDRANATDISVADGTAYLVVNDDGGTVKALDTATGAIRWTSGMGSRGDRPAPPVVAGGVVALHGEEQVVALDIATGARRWSAPDRGTGAGTVDTPPVALGSTVYALSSSNGRLYAFDAATGAQQWVASTDISSPWLLAAGPAVADTLFVASIGGDVQAWGNG
jgi:outer membrane protein assembly factor BamB